MNTLFNNPTIELNTLFILGNGFDISHGIKSRYSDFKEWVSEQKNQRLIDLMDIFFSNKRDLWSEVEAALGEYDEEAILNFCRPNEDIDYNHMTRSITAIEDGPDWIFKPILEEFIEQFILWVNSIDISQATPKFQLPITSQYLTFNYTDTLEKIYNIPYLQITHIHGSRINKNNEYVIGHNNRRNPDTHDTLSGELYFEQDTKNKIIGWMNELEKDTTSIINAHSSFFNNLSNIETVIVRGHSLDKVDWPYFEKVIQSITPTARWIFYYYTLNDFRHIQDFVSQVKLENCYFKEQL